MIEAIKKGGAPRARVLCDECGHEETVPCAYHGPNPDEGQIIKKLSQKGWGFVKGKIYCSVCEAKRKVVPMKKPEPVTEHPREPTRAQKREIMDMLEAVYDTDQERYKSGDTDETVSEVLGVMPGWVAQIREDFFGPDGGNEEIERLSREVATLVNKSNEMVKAGMTFEGEIKKLQASATSMSAALEKIKKAVGQRVLTKAGIK